MLLILHSDNNKTITKSILSIRLICTSLKDFNSTFNLILSLAEAMYYYHNTVSFFMCSIRLPRHDS